MTLVLAILFFLAAMLYASVGNAGASSYLAVMAFWSFPLAEMKSTALALNILVAAIAAYKFYRAGCFVWDIFWPFALTSIPFSFLGGSINLPGEVYRTGVAVILFFTAYRLFRGVNPSTQTAGVKPIPLGKALVSGALIGLVAGLIGLGGGIFLGPLLLMTGWADARRASGASAFFNLANSAAGLVGNLSLVSSLPAAIPLWAVTAGAGGWIGAELGSRHLAPRQLQKILAVILLIAASRILIG